MPSALHDVPLIRTISPPFLSVRSDNEKESRPRATLKISREIALNFPPLALSKSGSWVEAALLPLSPSHELPVTLFSLSYVLLSGNASTDCSIHPSLDSGLRENFLDMQQIRRKFKINNQTHGIYHRGCLLYTSPSPRDRG